MKKVSFIIFVSVLTTFSAVTVFADHHAVKSFNKEGLGSYLADSKGMTLYGFAKDKAGMSACAGECLEKWPIYYRENLVPPEGVLTEDFSTLTRADGQKQTSFRGSPLYYFFKDREAGDTTGHAVKNLWYVVDPGNFPRK